MKILVIILAVIGAIVVVGFLGMLLMHFGLGGSMMDGMGGWMR